MDHRVLLEQVVAIARIAGEAVLQVYAAHAQVRDKADGSPVTRADELAEQRILPALAALVPGIAAVSEEAAARCGAPDVGARFWLVDPLDGTREFLARNGEFTVNIALVEDGEPVLGAVFAPALGRLFAGGRGVPALLEENGRRRPIACRRAPAAGLSVVVSRSHADRDALDTFLAGRRVAALSEAGSSLKFCMLACGEADLYPRLGHTMEWDTAAGHAVLAAAGGRVESLDGAALRYGKRGFANPHFVASGW